MVEPILPRRQGQRRCQGNREAASQARHAPENRPFQKGKRALYCTHKDAEVVKPSEGGGDGVDIHQEPGCGWGRRGAHKGVSASQVIGLRHHVGSSGLGWQAAQHSVALAALHTCLQAPEPQDQL